MRLVYFLLGFKRCYSHVLLADRRFQNTHQDEAQECDPSVSCAVPAHWELVLASQATCVVHGPGGVQNPTLLKLRSDVFPLETVCL